MSEVRTIALIEELRKAPAESAYAEFKENNADPAMIGRTISALSNAARLAEKDFGYIVWGISNDDRRIVGTSFQPAAHQAQKHPFEFWLAQRLQPSIHLRFENVDHLEGRLVLLEIPAASGSPVEFDGTAYIRIGSATPRLSDYPERQGALWDKLRPYNWERGVVAQFLSDDEVFEKLDVAAYFSMTGQPQPSNPHSALVHLSEESVLKQDVGSRWNITNLGAILFARRLEAFDHRIARKALRLVAYAGNSRADIVTYRLEESRGYANGFASMIGALDGLLPRNEHIDKAFRDNTALYPPIAIRELLANALIHQDMSLTGTGPMIEVFRDRLEITNPGMPLVSPERFIDAAPRSRNEVLAALMRRMRICEEQGTGIDKAISAVELFQLPPPDFRVEEAATRVILYAPRLFASMSAEERVRACYQHAVLKYVRGDRMKNRSLRERFGIEDRNAAQASQVIKLALEKGLIRPADPNRPQAAYLPYWA